MSNQNQGGQNQGSNNPGQQHTQHDDRKSQQGSKTGGAGQQGDATGHDRDKGQPHQADDKQGRS